MQVHFSQISDGISREVTGARKSPIGFKAPDLSDSMANLFCQLPRNRV
jgi:hypothetical protein